MNEMRTVLDEVERVPTHLSKLLDMLEKWEARVANELDAVPVGQAPDKQLAGQLSEITKTSASVAKEMRHWIGKVQDTVKGMSLEDQVKVSLRVIMGLSKGDRLKAYNLMMGLEKQADDGGIKLWVGDGRP